VADGIVTYAEFCDYYKDISASIDNDDYFALMMKNSWKIDGWAILFEYFDLINDKEEEAYCYLK
jgi:hypothetical protein